MARTHFATYLSQKIFWLMIGTIFTDSAAYSSTDIDRNTCTTPGCIKAAARISNNINEAFDPCNHFHQFACGGYFRKTIVPKNLNGTNRYTESYFELQEIIKVTIEKKMEDNELRPFQLLQSYYNVCMNANSTIGENEKGQILKIIDDLGGWPVLLGENWNKSQFNLDDFIYKIRKLGFEKATKSFVDFEISLLKGTRHIRLSGASTGINRKYLIASSSDDEAKEIVRKYVDKMIHYATLLGADPMRARTELTKSLEFEKKLAQISHNSDDPLFGKLSNILSKFPTFPWDKYLEEFLPKTNYTDDELDVNVYELNVNFMDNWLKLVANTPKDILANYAIWRVVEELMDMSQNLANKNFKHWQMCIKHLTKFMPLAVGALYVRNDFNKTLKVDVENMVDNIRKSYKHVISETKWLNEMTKNKAKEKLDSMKINVAYPDEYLDNKKLDDYHKNLPYPTENFYLALLNLNKFHKNNEIEMINNTNGWNTLISATEMNAINYAFENSIDIYAGIIREEYVSDRPNYLNYAIMGNTIGHEMTHAFDTFGINLSSDGRLANLFIEDSQAKEHYDENVKCITDQFSKYRYGVSRKRIPLDIEMILQENIADIGGIQIACHSYEEWEKQNGAEPILPGLDSYTPRQLFWIGAASVYCSKYKIAGFKELDLDVHSPDTFRIVGSVVNMPEFARDFNCKVGSRMNPTKRCTLW